MKAIWFAIMFFIFNLAMGVVVNSGLYSGTYYDSEMNAHYGGLVNYTNLSKTEIEAQATDVWDYILNPLSFNWANQYAVQLGLAAQLAPFIAGLNILMLIIYGIALVELFWRRDIFGSGD